MLWYGRICKPSHRDFSKIEQIRTEIGIDLDWEFAVSRIPERFAPMVMGIEHSGIDVTIDSIKTKLDFAADGSSQQSTSGSAFAGSSGNTGKFYRNEVDRRHQHPSPSSRGNENIKKMFCVTNAKASSLCIPVSCTQF